MNARLSFFLFYILPIPVILISLWVGSSNLADPLQYLELIYRHFTTGLDSRQLESLEIANQILLDIRLPRVVLTFLIGAALGTSGTVLQGILRNPLVDSYILGISSGAAFGAALALAFGFLSLGVSAFIFALIAVGLTYIISGDKGHQGIVSVVLSGMVMSGIFTAMLSVVQYVVNPFKLSAIVQWTLGNLHTASWQQIHSAFPSISLSLLVIFLLRWRLNLLALGDDAARAVGVNPNVDKILLISAVTLMTAASVAVAGIISMYGLFLPHIVRMITGADHQRTIPGSILFGGTFLLIIDNFSRALFQFEVPVGVFTMILGGVFFIYLMRKNKPGWI